MSLRILLCVLALTRALAFAATALDPVLSLDGLWAMKADDFQSAMAPHRLPFRWNSTTQDAARAAGMT